MERIVSARRLDRHHRGGEIAAELRTEFADATKTDWYRPDLWPDFRWYHVIACFALVPAVAYLQACPALWPVAIDLLQAQHRIFSDNTTTAMRATPI
jgi:hypothetical protein